MSKAQHYHPTLPKKRVHVNNITHLSNRNQALVAEEVYQKSVGGFIAQSNSVVNRVASLSDSAISVLNELIKRDVNSISPSVSQESLSNRTRRWRSTVQSGLNHLRDLGLISWKRGAWKECNSYSLCPAIFRPEVTKILKSLFPVLAFFFHTSQLSSKPLQKTPTLTNRSLLNKENIKKKSYLRNDRRILYSGGSIRHSQTEITGDTRITTPGLRPNEIQWLQKDNDLSEHSRWAGKNPGKAFRLRGGAARFFENEDKTLKRERVSLYHNPYPVLSPKKERVVMVEKSSTMTPKQREKYKEEAMRRLIPQAIKRFYEIPLSTAGRISLAKYTNSALENAKKNYNKTLHPLQAFKDFCYHAEQFMSTYNQEINTQAVKILREAFNVSPGDQLLKRRSKRPECSEYVHEKKEPEKDLVYVHYFKLYEELKVLKEASGLELANPYKAKYKEFLEEAAKETNQDITILHSHFRDMYHSKERDEVHTPRATDTAPAS